MATTPASAGEGFAGNVVVADSDRRRITEFTAWGVFVQAWGWDVVQSGPDNTGTGFEICVRANGDVCKAGTPGGGAGQFGEASPQGVAVDSAGNVYVVDRGLPSNRRVQKFDPEGHFLLTFGKGVNETSGGNICPRPGFPADVCKAGAEGTGPGEFSGMSVVGNYIGVDRAGTASDDRIYVGDQGRIQRFNSSGEYEAEIATPTKIVRALAVDPSGNVYAAFCGAGCAGGVAAEANVHKWNSAGVEQSTVAVSNPQALASGANGYLYVIDGTSIRQFSPASGEIAEEETAFPFFPTFPFTPGFGSSNGIAIGDACWTSPAYDLYATNAAVSPGAWLRAYGPTPDEAHVDLCPPPERPPRIEDQGVVSVGTDLAVVQAKINPLFWRDTSYHIQYATAACIEGAPEGWDASCVNQKPFADILLGAGVTNVGAKTVKIPLTGLPSGTEYLFRFVAQNRFDQEGAEVNGKGGPVSGMGGTEAEDGEAASFTTNTVGSEPQPHCLNDDLRIEAAAFLPDCRAYEMVSPLDKNGGDIRPTRGDSYIQSSDDGKRITYSAIPAFAGQPSNKVNNQYLANRSEGAAADVLEPEDGWSNRGINAPLGQHIFGPVYPFNDVVAFSADLCNEWLTDFNVTPLTPDAKPGFGNLYHQDLCGGQGFEALTTSPLPEAEYINNDAVQGFSSEMDHVFFVATAGLTSDAVPGSTNQQIYEYEQPTQELRLVSVLPDGSADPGSVTRGGEVGGGGIDELGGNLEHAVSDDGSRVYWTSRIADAVGRLFLRLNPAQPESAHLHGAGTATGNLIGPAKGNGNLVSGSTAVKKVKPEGGQFAVGQEVTGEGIEAGSKITAIEEEKPTKEQEDKGEKSGLFKLTLDKAATVKAEGVLITGIASNVITNVKMETGDFLPEAEIAGAGILAGTTMVAVEEVGPEVLKLTLSAAAASTQTAAHLSATSECTESKKACTVPVSGGPGATFWTATPDGATALYSEGALEGKIGQGTLFRYDVQTQASTPVVEGLKGVLGASADLSRIYYVSSDDLTFGQENGYGDEAQVDKPNLYLDEEGERTFVATLASDEAMGGRGTGETYNIVSKNSRFRAARVTSDGSHIAFESRASLTGFDNIDANSDEPDVEVFTFGVGSGLQCVSCHPSGVRPSGREMAQAFRYPLLSLSTGVWAAAWIPGWEQPLRASRVLSDNGKRIFFNSNTSLVARDTNGAQDVYEWEALGEGSCTEESLSFHKLNGGCVYLITSGESPFESEFWDASGDGRDVFFTTESSLLPQDPGNIDVYDARVGGGFPQPSRDLGCEGEACQSPPGSPESPTPASAAVVGTGNVNERKLPHCRHGKVRRRGRCVTRKPKRERRRGHSRRAAR